MEAKAINICQSRPSSEHVEDSEEDETPLQICEVKYKPGDRLFMTRILSEPAIVSQKVIYLFCDELDIVSKSL